MAGKNSQVHLFLETEMFNKIKKEAEVLKISINETIRRKLDQPPIEEEIIVLRKFKRILKNVN